MSIPHYKISKCRCDNCRQFHDDIVLATKEPNQHGWIRQLCDECLSIKLVKSQYDKYLAWKASVLEQIFFRLPPDLPVE